MSLFYKAPPKNANGAPNDDMISTKNKLMKGGSKRNLRKLSINEEVE